MSESGRLPADITLAVDGEGVIRTAASSQALSHEALDGWLGRRWLDVAPDAAETAAGTVDTAEREGESASFVINQRLPSGRELLFEYTTVRLSAGSGFIAIGRSVQTVSDLKGRLASVRREREQDYWKLRETESRYRALLEAASEAVALVRVGTLRVVEANALAAKAFGLVPGAEFFPDLPERERRALDALLETARTTGRAPRILLHVSPDTTLSLLASTLTSEAGAFYILQLSRLPLAGPESRAPREAPPSSLEALVRRLPQAFIVVDRDGMVLSANDAFLDLVQADLEAAVVGADASRWLSLPGTGVRNIIDHVVRRGAVQSLRTTLLCGRGVLADVEIVAVGDQSDRPNTFGILVREVGGEGRSAAGGSPGDATLPRAAASPLGTEVRSSVEAVERRRLKEALDSSGGKRSLAAMSLGISRQSLHAKIKKYAL